jgi:hypothetical protein
MQIIGQSRNIISLKHTARMGIVRRMAGTKNDRTEMTA